MTTYYVATTGSDSGAGSANSPWRTISKAMKSDLKPDDEVVVKSGTYKEAVVVSKDGSAGKYITVRSEVPGAAKIDPPGDKHGIHINANYVTVDGFDISGSNNSGITAVGLHHVNITNNIVHDNVSNGIFVGKFDFVTVEGNTVYGNAARGAASGIHLKGAYNITGNNSDSGYRIIVRDNASYGNEWKYGPRTDASGISLDDFRNTQISSLPAYQFKSLVDNNVVYSNTGRGIQLAWSDNVTVRDNISAHNNADSRTGPWLSELANMDANNNTWTGNIAVTDAGNPAIANISFVGDPSNKNISWSYNTTFNGKQGDDSVYANAANSKPTSADGNKLGSDPGLSLSKVKAMGAALTGNAYSDSASEIPAATADAEVVPTEKVGADEATGVTVTGDHGDNEVYGGAGDDRLYGYSGADYLSGGDGSDMLLGGTGKDTLVGGADDDVFAFRFIAQAGNGSQRDVILDFSHSQGDKIDLSGIDADTNVSGNQAFSYIDTQGFSGKAGELNYQNGIVSGDVNGDKVADFQIEIANDHPLGSGDFLL